jgi:hypothetical protein
MRKIILCLALVFTAAPAVAKDLHCTPRGGCSDQIRVPW